MPNGSLFLLDDKYEELVEKSVVFGVEGEARIDENLKKQFKSGIGIAGEVFNSGLSPDSECAKTRVSRFVMPSATASER